MSSKVSKPLTMRKGIATILGAVTALGIYLFVYKPYRYQKDTLSFEAEARYLFQKQTRDQDAVQQTMDSTNAAS